MELLLVKLQWRFAILGELVLGSLSCFLWPPEMKWVQSQSSGLHGLSALLSPCLCPLTFESVDQSGSSISSVWKRPPSNFSASGEPQSFEELWEEYFADPTQWWDNRADKRNPTSPDFRHIALSIYCCQLHHGLSKGHNGKQSIVPTAAREYRHIVQGAGSGAKKFMRV